MDWPKHPESWESLKKIPKTGYVTSGTTAIRILETAKNHSTLNSDIHQRELSLEYSRCLNRKLTVQHILTDDQLYTCSQEKIHIDLTKFKNKEKN